MSACDFEVGVTAGVRWLTEGPIAHFLSEKRRLMHSPAPLPRGSSDLPAVQSSASVSAIASAHAPATPATEAQLGGSTPAADERQADNIDLVLGWRISGTLGRPDRAGVHYMLDTKCQASPDLLGLRGCKVTRNTHQQCRRLRARSKLVAMYPVCCDKHLARDWALHWQ